MLHPDLTFSPHSSVTIAAKTRLGAVFDHVTEAKPLARDLYSPNYVSSSCIDVVLLSHILGLT
jgi:hypothetical protein